MEHMVKAWKIKLQMFISNLYVYYWWALHVDCTTSVVGHIYVIWQAYMFRAHVNNGLIDMCGLYVSLRGHISFCPVHVNNNMQMI